MSDIPVSESSLWILHSSISIVTLVLCYLYIVTFDALTQIGSLWKSPIIPVLITSEFIKSMVNVKRFNLVGRPKHIPTTTYQLRLIDRVKNTLSIVLTLVAFLFAYAFTCIIFGAAIIEHLSGTICLSIVLVTFSVLPLTLYLGGRATWELMFCDHFELTSKSQVAYLELVQNNAIVSLFGAWISSIVAPLDWDREWQTYPIPNVCGALMGMAVSNVYWLINGMIKRFVKQEEGIKRRKLI